MGKLPDISIFGIVGEGCQYILIWFGVWYPSPKLHKIKLYLIFVLHNVFISNLYSYLLLIFDTSIILTSLLDVLINLENVKLDCCLSSLLGLTGSLIAKNFWL